MTSISLSPFLSIYSEAFSGGKILGVGKRGAVYEAYSKIEYEPIAIKCLQNVDEDSLVGQRFIREILILLCLRNSLNIITLFDVKLLARDAYIISDCYEYNFEKILYSEHHRIGFRGNSSFTMSNSDFVIVLHQILTAINHIHMIGVIHTELTPSNILINLEYGRVYVKICGFGAALVLNRSGLAEVPQIRPCHRIVGQLRYKAPEVLLQPRLLKRAQDIWSAACSFVELVSESSLFSEGCYEREQLKFIAARLSPMRTNGTKNVSAVLRQLMVSKAPYDSGLLQSLSALERAYPGIKILVEQMLRFNPDHRIDSETALSSHVFTNRAQDYPSAETFVPERQHLRQLQYVEELNLSYASRVVRYTIIKAAVRHVLSDLSGLDTDGDAYSSDDEKEEFVSASLMTAESVEVESHGACPEPVDNAGAVRGQLWRAPKRSSRASSVASASQSVSNSWLSDSSDEVVEGNTPTGRDLDNQANNPWISPHTKYKMRRLSSWKSFKAVSKMFHHPRDSSRSTRLIAQKSATENNRERQEETVIDLVDIYPSLTNIESVSPFERSEHFEKYKTKSVSFSEVFPHDVSFDESSKEMNRNQAYTYYRSPFRQTRS